MSEVSKQHSVSEQSYETMFYSGQRLGLVKSELVLGMMDNLASISRRNGAKWRSVSSLLVLPDIESIR